MEVSFFGPLFPHSMVRNFKPDYAHQMVEFCGCGLEDCSRPYCRWNVLALFNTIAATCDEADPNEMGNAKIDARTRPVDAGTRSMLEQRIQSVFRLNGKVVSLTFYAYFSRIYVYIYFFNCMMIS